MSKLYGILGFLMIFSSLISTRAENLLNEPESAVYDYSHNRYLVSNWGNGNIIAIGENNEQSVFCAFVGSSVAGLYIYGDLLIAAVNYGDNPGLTGINLATGEVAKVIYIPEMNVLNGITADTSGYLYVTEWTNDKIFKVNFEAGTYSVFVDSGLEQPNGITFDAENNRLLFVMAVSPGYPIMALNPADSSISTVYNTAISPLDGLAQDKFGFYYFSSWQNNSVYACDREFSSPPFVVSSGHDSPADISCDDRNNLLVIPNYNGDRLDLVNPYAGINADIFWGNAPLEVAFTGSSMLAVDNWKWHFGDGDSAGIQNPTYIYQNPGMYDVSLEIGVGDETVSLTESDYIIVLADSLYTSETLGEPGDVVEVIIDARSTIPLNYLRIPVEYAGSLNLTLDSFSTSGCRADCLESKTMSDSDPTNRRATFLLRNINLETAVDMPEGFGPVLKLYFTIDPAAVEGQSAPVILDGYLTNLPRFKGMPNYYLVDYNPGTIDGSISLPFVCGDCNGSGTVNLLDITYLIGYLYKNGPEPDPMVAADIDGNGGINILDITYLIKYLYKLGPYPQCS
ncbi:MAG: dockerin type I domain-containing protein [Candidatus Zixiibacteriota bacterium]